MPDPKSTLGLTCPSGSSFYVCGRNATAFIGCCTEDACAHGGSGSCPKGSLRPASFAAEHYDDIPAQACASKGASWYTCKFSSPPFMGCCTSNPCAGTASCPAADLVPAMLSADAKARAAFAGAEPSTSTTSMTSTTSTSMSKTVGPTTGPTPASTNVTAAAAAPPQSGGGPAGLSPGATAGIAVGSVAGLLAVAWGLFFMYRRGVLSRAKHGRRESAAIPWMESPIIDHMKAGSSIGSVTPSPAFTPYKDAYGNSNSNAFLLTPSFAGSSPPPSNAQSPVYDHIRMVPYHQTPPLADSTPPQSYRTPNHSRNTSQVSELDGNSSIASRLLNPGMFNPPRQELPAWEGPVPARNALTSPPPPVMRSRSQSRGASPLSTPPQPSYDELHIWNGPPLSEDGEPIRGRSMRSVFQRHAASATPSPERGNDPDRERTRLWSP